MTTEHFKTLTRTHLHHSMIMAYSEARNASGELEIVTAQFEKPIPEALALQLVEGGLVAVGANGAWVKAKPPVPAIEEGFASLTEDVICNTITVNGKVYVPLEEAKEEILLLQREQDLAIDTRNRAQESASNSALAKQAAEEEAAGLRAEVAALRSNSIERFFQAKTAWSAETFGTDYPTEAIARHIELELVEIRENPSDLLEWIDVVMLGFEGYWRNGGASVNLTPDLWRKLEICKQRSYPAPVGDEPAEHVREGEAASE